LNLPVIDTFVRTVLKKLLDEIEYVTRLSNYNYQFIALVFVCQDRVGSRSPVS